MTERVKPVTVRAPKAKIAVSKAPKEIKSPEQKAAERAAKKAEREAEQKEADRKGRLESHLQSLRREFIPEPPAHRTYKQGERVILGAHPNAVIAEVFDDGLYYLVNTFGTYSEYGRPVERTGEHVMSWISLQPYREPDENEKIQSVVMDTEDIHMSMGQRDISGLLHMYYHSGLDTEPDYQRGLCWDMADNLAYIESVFEGRDLGKFVAVQLEFQPNGPSYELLDGKQRLNALRLFYEDRMAYKGKLFSQLKWLDQNRFESTPIAFGRLTRVTRAQKLKVFLKLNTGGRPQDPAWLKHVQSMLDEESRAKFLQKVQDVLDTKKEQG